MNRRQVRDITAIMDVEPGMIPFLGRLDYPDNMLNPWGEGLREELARLDLEPASRVLDIPCGTGGVAVLVAQAFGARVRGYDVLPAHVEKAVAYAERMGVGDTCVFTAGDLRDVVLKEHGYDAVLWIAAPHVWPDTRATIRALRQCVRPGGTVFVADAYRPTGVPQALSPGYPTLDETTAGFGSEGDAVFLHKDPATDWERDFQVARRAAVNLLETLREAADRRVVRRYLDDLDDAETRDSMGCAFWRVVRRES